MRRVEMREKLNEALEIDPTRTALVAIDMHRGHLDPEIPGVAGVEVTEARADTAAYVCGLSG